MFSLQASFEIASDAAASFREILTRHKALISEYFESNHAVFFGAYNQMLEKGNYVTRRQSLKLLSELLLDRANLASMLRYVFICSLTVCPYELCVFQVHRRRGEFVFDDEPAA